MIAPEYFNNHIAVEGEIVVKRVPNDTGSVVVWNSATKKLSIRTHAEIVADLNLATVSTNQLITGIKSFVTSGGNYAPFNNTLQIYADDGSLPSMTYSKGGSHVGQIMFNSDGFYFKNGDNNAFYNVKAGGFEKSNSDNNHVLLGGGDHKAVSDFALSSDLSNVVTTNTAQTVIADKVFKKITTTDWVIPRYLAFPDASGTLPNYIGFYMWNSQWQVNWRDASNTYAYPLLDIDGVSKNANFYGNTTAPKFTTPGGNSDQWNEAYSSLHKKEDDWFHSARNFPQGTLIQTDVDYSQTYGDQFLLEMKGNMYGGGNPLIANIQGYIYYDTIIAKSGYSTLYYWNYIIALNLDGKLCFWFPALSYWQGFDVKVTIGNGGLDQGKNRVISVSDSQDPGGTKRVEIALEHLLTKEQLISGNTFWEKKNISSYWAMDSDKEVAVVNGNSAQRLLSGGLLASDGYTDSQHIPAYGIHAKGSIQSDEGFVNRYYKVNQRNKIWNFGDSTAWGLSYFQGNYHSLGEGISFHFGDAGDYKFFVKDNGNIYTKNDVTAGNFFNGKGLYSPVLSGGQVIHAGNSSELYFGNPVVPNVYIESGNNNLLHNRSGYGIGIIWDQHNFNPDHYIPTSHPVYNITQNEINGWRQYVRYWDNRNIQPAHTSPEKLQFGFTNWFNNGDQESHYADYLHFGGYQDGSGGNQNLIMFSKNGFGLRQFQGSWQGVSKYQSYVDYWNTRHFSNADINNWKDLVTGSSKALKHITPQNFNLISYVSLDANTAAVGFVPYNYQHKIADNGATNNHPDMYQGMMISGNDPINVHNFSLYVDQQSQLFVTGGLYDQFDWKKVWTEQHFSQGDINAWQFNRFNTQPMGFLGSTNNANDLTASGFYQIGYGTQNSGADLGIDDNVRALLHFETENMYSASQIQTQRYEGNIISRAKADGGWSGWVRHWGNNDFTKSDINNWNSKANFSHTHLSLYNEENNSDADTHTLLEDNKFKFVHRINAGSAGSFNMFPAPNNANSIFAVATHPGGYGTLLGINGESEIFTKTVSAGTYSPTWRQLAYKDWVLQQIPSLNNYVTLDTEQNIASRKTFSASISNGYTGAPVMINGNGNLNTIFPTLAFHQPGLYAGTLSYRGNGFYFMNIDGNGFDFVRAAGYVKDGSSNQMLLLGDGSHEDKNKYVFGSNHTGTIQAYSPDTGLPINSFKPAKSGFYRPNNENEYGSLLMWAEHPQTGNGSYGSGIAFDYAGTNAYLTGIDGAGNKTPNKKLWHSGDLPQSYVTEWINASNAGVLTNGSAVQVDGGGGINHGSDSRPNKVWFDYNWAGSGRAGSVINFSGLNPAYNVELFAAYHGDSNAIGIRTRNGDNGLWSLPRWLWNSENFNPDNKVNKSGDTMTGTLSFANNVGGVLGNMGDDDYYRIIGRTNGYDNGYLEIATADGGTEPVHVRQYAGVFTNLIRTATLLDENGNTSFPGTVYSQGFIKANSDNSMLLLGGGGHKPISDFATVSQLGNFVSKSGDNMTGPLVISTNDDALTVTTSGSVLNAKLYNSSSDSIIRMQSITHPFWDIRAQADGRFLLENNSVTRLSMDSSANINFSGTSLKFNGHNIWDVNNLNPVTLDTPQTIVNEKTFSSGLGLTGGKSIFLKGFSDTAHRVQWFDDDSDGFAVSSAFSVKPYNDLSVSWFTANSGGAYSNGNRIWDAGNLIPVKLDGGKSSVLLSDIGFNNLNDLQQTGFFKGSNLINAPLNSPEWFFLICEYHYTGWVSQTATSYGTGSVKAGRTFKRSFTGGTTWTDWNEVITTLTFNPDHYQPIGSYLTTNTTQTIDVTKTIGFQNTIYSGWDRSSVTNPQMGPFSLLNLALQGAYPLYGDEEFRNGSNNIIVYNNYGNGTVTMTRETASNLPNRSGVQLRFNYNGNGATPGLGGFILGFNARPNAVFIQKFMAKLPVGYAFNNAENYMGDNASVNWLTSRAGTGKWETYVRAVICGTGTSFGNGGHVYVEGPDTAMEFCLAFAEIYEINSSVFSRIKESFYDKNETIHFNGAISDLITVGDSYAQKKLLSTSWDGTNGDQILFRVPGNQNNGAYLRYSQYGTLNGNIGLFGSDSLTGGQILNANGDVLYVGNHALPNILLQAVNNVHLNYAGAGSIYTFNVNGVYLDRNINFNLDNSGINFYEGGKIYKKAGGGIYINKGNNGLDPKVENADGSQSWAIFHEGNHTPFKNLRGGAVLEEVSESGIYRQEGSTSGYNYTTTLNLNSSDGRQQLTIERSGGGMKFRGSYYGSGNQGWSDWKDVIHSGNITAYLNNYAFITQSNLNTQLAGYATLNGVQTFTNTNTFTSSPVIPNGTLGAHAVNKNQIQLNTGTEGENGQQLTISGNNSVNLTNFFVTSRDGSRNPDDIAPNSTPKRVRFDFAYATTAGLGGSGKYAGIMTYSPWDGTSASTGDSSYQLAFANQTGIDGSGIPMLKIRKGINGNWTSLWYKFWTEADFSLTNIQQWNHIAQFGLQLNQTFSATTGYNLMISDDYFGNESGLVDAGSESFVAGRVKEYYKYGSRIKDGLEGINYHLEKRTIGIGGEADKNKVSVKGCVKATENFKSKDERADTIFIPDGNVASLKDEIINDESEYAIRLDPHHYEIDPSGYLEVDDRNRLIHVIGEQVKMAVDFKEIYPKQQIVIYNFDQKNYPLAVLIKGKVVYNIEPGLFLRLYVTESLRVIAERPQPCEFVW